MTVVTPEMKRTFRSPVAAYVLFLIGFGLNLIGVASPFWLHRKFTGYSHSQGLWRWCILWPVFSTCSKMAVQQPWHDYVKKLEALGLLLATLSFVCLTGYLLSTLCRGSRILLASSYLCFGSVAFACAGLLTFTVAVFLLDEDVFTVGSLSVTFFKREHVSWAFYLTWLGTALMFASGMMSYKLSSAVQIRHEQIL